MTTRHTPTTDDINSQANRAAEQQLDAAARQALNDVQQAPTTTATPDTPPTQETTDVPPAVPDDGSTPLTTGRPTNRHEHYCILRAQGETQAESYKLTGNRRLKKATAAQAASNLERTPEVTRRIQYLKMHARNKTTPPDAPEQPTTPTKAPAKRITSLDREAILAALTTALNEAVAGSKSSDISASIREIRAFLPSLLHERDESMPDPLAVVTYLCTSATKRPSDIRKELGGMDWVLARVQALTRCPPDQFIASATCVTNAVTQREAKRVRR